MIQEILVYGDTIFMDQDSRYSGTHSPDSEEQTERAETVMNGDRRAFAGLSEIELALVDGIILITPNLEDNRAKGPGTSHGSVESNSIDN